MAYASSLRRVHNGIRWPGPPSGWRPENEYKAKHRPIGLTIEEAREVLAAMSTLSGEVARSARRKLETWIARFEPNILECLHCGYHWVTPMPCGTTPKRCQMCGGYADVEGETMIIPSRYFER